VGDSPPEEIQALAAEDVVVTGFVPDVKPCFDKVRLSVAPLRFGAGVKGKINQSMSFGVPVVGTTLAVEGMGLTPDADVLVADAPGDFARKIVELYTSEPLWNRLSANGLAVTRRLYSVEAVRTVLQAL